MPPSNAPPEYPKLRVVPQAENPHGPGGTPLRPALGYVRMSIDREGEALGIGRQEEEIRAWAPTRGLEIVAVYPDREASATSGKVRAGFERLLADLAALPERERVVVAWAQDRLLRTTADLERVIGLGAEAHFKTAGRGDLDLTTPAGRAVARTVAAWSQFETEQKALRQQARNWQAHKEGKAYWTRRPFGYELDGTPNEVEADAIRWAAATILEGGAVREIAREWARRGLITYKGNPWSPVQIRRVLLSERIVGLRSFNGLTVRGTWTPILPESDWRQVVAILTDPRRGSGSPKGRTPTTLLGGIARCGRCDDGVMRGARVQGVPYYRCCGAARDLYRKADVVDAYVEAVVLERLASPQLAAVHQHDTIAPDPVEELTAEAEQLRSRRSSLSQMWLRHDGTISDDQFAEMSQGLNERLTAIETELARVPRGVALAPFVGADDVRAMWAGYALERKRAVIQALLAKVTLLPARGRFDPASVELAWATPRGPESADG